MLIEEMHHIEEPLRNEFERHRLGSPTHDNDLFEDDLDWDEGRPLSIRRFTRNHVYDDFRHLVRVSPQPFDGNLGPKAFLEWTTTINLYFEWSAMPEHLHVNFVCLLLVGPAHLHCVNVEWQIENQNLSPIMRWEEMKYRLKEKKVLPSYQQHLLD